MRDLLFKDFLATMNIYEKTFKTRTELKDVNVSLRFNHFFTNKTQIINFET